MQILAQAVQLIITNYSFDKTPCLKTIKEIGGRGMFFTRGKKKEVQVFSPQLTQQKVEILNVENVSKAQQIVKNVISPPNLSEFPVARRLQFFLQNWDKLTSDPDRTTASYVQF